MEGASLGWILSLAVGLGVARGAPSVAPIGVRAVGLRAKAATEPRAAAQDEGHWIARRTWHLGNDETPDWSEASPTPDGTRLDLEFEVQRAPAEAVLELWQRSIDQDWYVELNGVRVATLRHDAELRRRVYALPAGALRAGENRLSVVGEQDTDDVTVGRIRWFGRGLREHLDLFRRGSAITEKAP